MNLFFKTLLLSLIQFVNHAECGNILFMHPYASYSHRVSTMPLANELVNRGHSVTFIAPMPAAKPNPKILDIRPKALTEFVDASLNAEFDISVRLNNKLPIFFTFFDEVLNMACEMIYSSEEFQTWLQTSPKIDVIIVDMSPECAVGLAFKLQSKVILLSTIAFWGKFRDTFHLPDESLSAYADNPYKKDMSFVQRIKNTLLPLAWAFYKYLIANKMEEINKKYLNISDSPSIYDLERNVSLVMLSGNYIGEQPLSLPPMFVSVPGIHVQDTSQPLPKELEQFINSKDDEGNVSEGFIYISFGTLVKPAKLPKKILNVFLNSIRANPRIRFLWRWDGEFTAENKPKNLYIAKWFPQQDVLGHKRIRGFITQAGRPSSQEALKMGVPMITFPVLGDQDYNGMRLQELGVGINLEIGEVTEKQLQDALTRILYDKEMIRNVQKKSQLFNDLPMKPLDTAVWYTEYILRHDDFSHLKPLARDQTWFQRRNLDVWTVILFVILSAIFLVLATIMFLFTLVSKYLLVNTKQKTL